MYLLDTDTVSFAIRGAGQVGARIRSVRPSEVAISAITLAELRWGADRKRSKTLHAAIGAFVRAVEVVAFDGAAAAAYGRIGAALAERGAPFGDFDVLIAGHAVALHRTLVTHNVRHFGRVAGLALDDWY
jgi:tRNA(fMet)-specific endonuclease VapC